MKITKEYKKNILNPETEIHYAISHSVDSTKFPHEHDFYELMLVIEGEIEVEFDDKKCLIANGTLLLIRPNEVHSKKFFTGSIQANLAFSKKVFDELFNYLGDGFSKNDFLNYDNIPMVLLSQYKKEKLIKKLQKLHFLPTENFSLIRTNLKIILFDIFTKYFVFYNNDDESDMPYWLSTSISKMNKKEHFMEGMPALIRISGKSHEHICRNTKKHLNTSPSKIINGIRLNYAANLLMNTDIKVIDICYECGFNNLSYFYSIFKEKYNYSPNKYRKNINATPLLK